MADTTIKVDSAVRDRLAALATERGLTLRALVTAFAENTPTEQELHERRRAAAAHVRDHFRASLDEADLEAGEAFWRDLESGGQQTEAGPRSVGDDPPPGQVA
jgi:hypothetical protein